MNMGRQRPYAVTGQIHFVSALLGASHLGGSGPEWPWSLPLLRSKNFLESRLHERDVFAGRRHAGGAFWAGAQVFRHGVIPKAAHYIKLNFFVGDARAS